MRLVIIIRGEHHEARVHLRIRGFVLYGAVHWELRVYIQWSVIRFIVAFLELIEPVTDAVNPFVPSCWDDVIQISLLKGVYYVRCMEFPVGVYHADIDVLVGN